MDMRLPWLTGPAGLDLSYEATCPASSEDTSDASGGRGLVRVVRRSVSATRPVAFEDPREPGCPLFPSSFSPLSCPPTPCPSSRPVASLPLSRSFGVNLHVPFFLTLFSAGATRGCLAARSEAGCLGAAAGKGPGCTPHTLAPTHSHTLFFSCSRRVFLPGLGQTGLVGPASESQDPRACPPLGSQPSPATLRGRSR